MKQLAAAVEERHRVDPASSENANSVAQTGPREETAEIAVQKAVGDDSGKPEGIENKRDPSVEVFPTNPPTVSRSEGKSPFDRLAALAAEKETPRAETVISSSYQPVPSESLSEPGNLVSANPDREPVPTRDEHHAVSSWRDDLSTAISKLEASSASDATEGDIREQTRLRLLYLASGDREKALEPIESLSAEADAFLTETLFGLDVWLDDRRIAEEDRRAAAALPHLTDAASHLGEVAPLAVRNLQLCTAVHSFGVVEPFKTDEFQPGQEVLVYAEVENFHAQETDKGFETVLEGSILLFDSRGRRVAEIELPKKEDLCGRRRRDFFLVYQVQLPERLYPGSHSLKLTVEDAGCRKVGQATLKFAVSEASE